MAGWLPEGFQVDERRMERSVSAVSGRIVRRKVRVRVAKRVATAALALAFVIGAPVILRTLRSASRPVTPGALRGGAPEGSSEPPATRSFESIAAKSPKDDGRRLAVVPAPTPREDGFVAAASDAAVGGPAVPTPATPSPVILRTLRGPSIAGSRSAERDPGTEIPRSTPRVTKERRAPDLPVTLAKVDHSVAVQWEGNPGEEFEVYRCESPTFETCSLAGRVQGTAWVEPGLDAQDGSATITYYKVVPRSGA